MGACGTTVARFTKSVCDDSSQSSYTRVSQMIDDTAHEHSLALAWVASNPEKFSIVTVPPLHELLMVEDPLAAFGSQAALDTLNPSLVELGVC